MAKIKTKFKPEAFMFLIGLFLNCVENEADGCEFVVDFDELDKEMKDSGCPDDLSAEHDGIKGLNVRVSFDLIEKEV